MSMSNVLWAVAFAAPQVIVYLIAVVLGLVNLSRQKSPALFSLLGGLIAAVVVVSGTVIRELLWANARTAGGDMEATANLTRFISIGSLVVEAVGMAMIVFAVFAGRKPVRQDDDEPTARPSRPRS